MQGKTSNVDVEDGLVDTGVEGEGRINRERSTDIYALARVKQMASEKLLCNTGSPDQPLR